MECHVVVALEVKARRLVFDIDQASGPQRIDAD